MSNKLVKLPYKGLRKSSKQVNFIDDNIVKLIKKMEDATLEWEAQREHEVGVALAAVQIDVHKRVIIIRNNLDNKKDTTFTVYINPEITKYYGEIVEEFEGCLSVSEVYGKVPRYSKVNIKAKDAQGKVVKITAEGFLARIFQHEIDHTNGIIFVDKIKDTPDAFHKLNLAGKIEKLKKVEREAYFNILW